MSPHLYFKSQTEAPERAKRLSPISRFCLILNQKEPFPRSEFTTVLNLDMLDAGRSPNADSPPRDHLPP